MKRKMRTPLPGALTRNKNKEEFFHTAYFWIAFLSGWCTFFAWMVSLQYLIFANIPTVVIVGVIVALIFISSIASDRRSVYCFPVGLGGLVGLFLATCFGVYCYDSYGYFTFLYENSRTYANTVPSEPAQSVADAGRLVFASEAYVDQTKSVGYAGTDGHRYCIAPVRDLSTGGRVEFWAVGWDCCAWQGEFTCDAAKKPDARGGIIVFDNNGIFTSSNFDQYNHARKKAEATYGIISGELPLYVRWVEKGNLDMLLDYYNLQMWTCITICSIGHAFFSGFFAFFLYKSHYIQYDFAAAGESAPIVQA